MSFFNIYSSRTRILTTNLKKQKCDQNPDLAQPELFPWGTLAKSSSETSSTCNNTREMNNFQQIHETPFQFLLEFFP